MVMSTRGGCTVPLFGTQKRVASSGGAMTSLGSIIADASPNSGHLTIASGLVRPPNAATRFSMTTVQITTPSQRDWCEKQSGAQVASRHLTLETCRSPFSKRTSVKMSCRGVLCIDTHAATVGAMGLRRSPVEDTPNADGSVAKSTGFLQVP